MNFGAKEMIPAQMHILEVPTQAFERIVRQIERAAYVPAARLGLGDMIIVEEVDERGKQLNRACLVTVTHPHELSISFDGWQLGSIMVLAENYAQDESRWTPDRRLIFAEKFNASSEEEKAKFVVELMLNKLKARIPGAEKW